MAQKSTWQQLCKPQFVEPDPEITTFLGYPASKVGASASVAALISAFLVIPAVFMAASKDENLKSIGIWLGYLIWAVFLLEVLIFIRLEKGWGVRWLKKHWLQVVVIFVASPLTAIVLKHAVMPMVSVLLSLQNMVSVSYVAKFITSLKILKLLHLEEVRQKIGKAARHVTWLYRTTTASIAICGLGIVGAAASGGAPTPVHGLETWWEFLQQAFGVAPELFLVSIPLVLLLGGFAIVQARWSVRANRRGSRL